MCLLKSVVKYLFCCSCIFLYAQKAAFSQQLKLIQSGESSFHLSPVGEGVKKSLIRKEVKAGEDISDVFRSLGYLSTGGSQVTSESRLVISGCTAENIQIYLDGVLQNSVISPSGLSGTADLKMLQSQLQGLNYSIEVFPAGSFCPYITLSYSGAVIWIVTKVVSGIAPAFFADLSLSRNKDIVSDNLFDSDESHSCSIQFSINNLFLSGFSGAQTVQNIPFGSVKSVSKRDEEFSGNIRYKFSCLFPLVFSYSGSTQQREGDAGFTSYGSYQQVNQQLGISGGGLSPSSGVSGVFSLFYKNVSLDYSDVKDFMSMQGAVTDQSRLNTVQFSSSVKYGFEGLPIDISFKTYNQADWYSYSGYQTDVSSYLYTGSPAQLSCSYSPLDFLSLSCLGQVQVLAGAGEGNHSYSKVYPSGSIQCQTGTEFQSVVFSGSRVVQLPNMYQLFWRASDSFGNDKLDSETGWSYRCSYQIKDLLFSHFSWFFELPFSISWFQLWLQDKIKWSGMTDDYKFYPINQSSMRSNNVEIRTCPAIDFTSFSCSFPISYIYTDARFTNGDQVSDGGIKDNYVPDVSKHQVCFAPLFQFSFSSSDCFLICSVPVTYQSRRYLKIDNDDYLSSLWLVDFQLEFSKVSRLENRYTCSVNPYFRVYNIVDKEYFTDYTQSYLGKRRTFVLGCKVFYSRY